jgi:hypothetical protein
MVQHLVPIHCHGKAADTDASRIMRDDHASFPMALMLWLDWVI